VTQKETLKRVSLVAIVLVLIGQFTYHSHISPVIQAISFQEEKISTLRGRLDQVQGLPGGETSLREKVKEKETELEGLRTLIPSEKKLPSLISYFHDATKRHNVLGNSIGFEEAREAEYGILFVDLSLYGQYEELMNFKREIKKSPTRLMVVESFTLSRAEVGLLMNITVRVFTQD